ncbi:1-deoxy-D-xylulose-5-phosphate synthase [Paenibacillus elgii]|uniref:1-deoxy-D-xylulose-5-phosphate synthase n=1 Tax=Paenibacillus elgii TaxID=189691 RepID=A0A2T6G6X1_9BACL|nr:transketolase C-terminal domain-containing protein [Paenibacillus elgii]PUA39895.1 1-deoxy-D-xylulose-5-phosphate synthase [Paenibacillus elgii]
MRKTFISTLMNKARDDERIFVITPDLGFSVLEKFSEEFPNRFLNVGIAEQNAVGVAAGLALSGKIVYVYSIIPFVTMRCFEQVRVDAAYINTNIRLVGVGAGLSYGPAGATHHSIEDIAIMRSLPNMTVCCPGDPVEVRNIVEQSFEHQGPMYIRLAKNGEPIIHPEDRKIAIGQAVKVIDGQDLAILTTSNTLELAVKWVEMLRQQGRQCMLVSFPTIKPLDQEMLKSVISLNIPVFTLEEHSVIGGLGSAVSEFIAESGKAVKFKRIALPDKFSHYVGSQQYIREKLGMTFENYFKMS